MKVGKKNISVIRGGGAEAKPPTDLRYFENFGNATASDLATATTVYYVTIYM